MDATGRDMHWLALFSDATGVAHSVTVYSGSVEHEETSHPTECESEQLVQVGSEVVVPDAVQRLHAAFPNPPSHEGVGYMQWLPCVALNGAIAPEHFVTVTRSADDPDDTSFFQVHYDDDAKFVKLCGPCQDSYSCDNCTP